MYTKRIVLNPATDVLVEAYDEEGNIIHGVYCIEIELNASGAEIGEIILVSKDRYALRSVESIRMVANCFEEFETWSK